MFVVFSTISFLMKKNSNEANKNKQIVGIIVYQTEKYYFNLNILDTILCSGEKV